MRWQEAVRLKSEFMYTMSHEYTLNAITVLRRMLSMGSKIDDDRHMIDRAVEQ
jgi:hypothetical protein